MDEPEAMRRLHGLAGDLRDVARLDSLLRRVLDRAMSLMGADLGTLQLRDPVTGSLWLVTQSGISPEFIDYFAVVDDGVSACGRAAQACAQAVISDVNADADFAPHRGIAAAAGFRAVQSTPLADYAGRLIGVVSTYFARPHLPPARKLRIMELYGDVAGDAIARRLGIPAGDGLGDPVGPAVLAALLGPADGQAPDPAMLAGGYAQGGDQGRPGHRRASLEDMMFQFAGEVVNRLFSVGLTLDGARSTIGDGPDGDRVAAATGKVDRMIRDIRTMMFSLAADAGTHASERWPAPSGAQPGSTSELLDWVMDSIFDIDVALQATADLPGGTGGPHLTEAKRRLDDMAQAIRDYLFAERAKPGLTRRPARGGHDRRARAAARVALQQRMAQTARSLQMSAAEAAALLERQADLTMQPQRLDYPTEIKRWRAFADQAAQLAKGLEQAP